MNVWTSDCSVLLRSTFFMCFSSVAVACGSTLRRTPTYTSKPFLAVSGICDGVPDFWRASANPATSAPSLIDAPAERAWHRSPEEASAGASAGLVLELEGLASALVDDWSFPQPAATPPSERRTAAIRTCFMDVSLPGVGHGKSPTVPREPDPFLRKGPQAGTAESRLTSCRCRRRTCRTP